MKKSRRMIALALSLALTLALAACGAPAASGGTASAPPKASAPVEASKAPAADGTYEIALVTDVGNIDDKSFNEGAWNGVKSYAEQNSVTYNYYRPTEDSTEARLEAIGTAITKGAKVIVCPGFMFGEALGIAQKDHPETMFLALDVNPESDMKVPPEQNLACITYQEEQAGYLAGYAAVKDGYTKLGFLGGMAVPAVVRYGYGFVQGADAAAAEMATDININYWYSGSFAPTDDIKIKMDGWYTGGTEAVFACGGGIYLSAVAAATAAGGKIIGVDSDQSYVDPCVITSAVKDLPNSVILALTGMYGNSGKWTADYAGKHIVLGAKENTIGLPTAGDAWRLKTFTQDEYKVLFDKLVSGDVKVSNDSSETHPTVSAHTTVDYQG